MITTRWIGLAAFAALAGCAPLSQIPAPPRVRTGELSQASQWAAAARRDLDATEAGEKSLAALRASMGQESPEAREIANAALGRFVESNVEGLILRSTEFTGTDGVHYRVRIDSPKGRPLAMIDDLAAIRPIRNRASAPLQWPGWGIPMIGVCKPDRTAEPFAPTNGYRLPVTVVADMHLRGSVCETTLRLLNPEETRTVTIAGTKRPVAGDIYAANMATFRNSNPLITGLRWLFAVDQFSYPTNLIFGRPYDPDRIPVVLVHGLLSTPAMWGEVVNALEADPVVRGHFQFWCFFYPTGQPIILSANELRRDLKAADSRYRIKQGTVLVGHSMGGIISRAAASSSGGSDLFNAVFGEDAPAVAWQLPRSELLRESFFFERVSSVRRVIFVCTPHRGSRLALAGPAGFFASLIRLPGNVVETVSEVAEVATTMNLQRPPNSIRGLSPNSPFLKALDQRPIKAPHHTILGDRGRGNSPNSSDGVVPYSSSHLATAESEVVVPAGHGGFRHPIALTEIDRILRLELVKRKNAEN